MDDAVGAIARVCEVIEQNGEALVLTPIGRDWIADAATMRRLMRED